MSRLVCVVALAVGSLLILSYVGWFGVNVPINDDWDHVETSLRWIDDGIDVATVFAPYNEHCIAATRLLAFGVLTTTGGDYRVLLGANATLALLTLAAALALVRRWPLPAWCLAPLAAALAVLLTAWCQWQILLWGCTTPWFILPSIAVVAAVAVARLASLRAAVAVAGVAAIAAVFCNSNGLFVGYALLPGLVLRLRDEPRTSSRRAAAAFAACLVVATVACGVIVSRGKGPEGGGIAAVLASPLEAAKCLLAVLGSPLDPVGAFHGRKAVSMILGAASMLLGASATVAAARTMSSVAEREGSLRPRELGPGLALMIYGLASVAAVVVGRLPQISANPVESRYQAFAIAWHAGVLLVCGCLAAGAGSRRRRVAWQGLLAVASAACVVTTLAAMPLFLVHGGNMRRALSEHQAIYREARLPGGRERLETISGHYGADRLLQNLEAMERRGILHPDLAPAARDR